MKRLRALDLFCCAGGAGRSNLREVVAQHRAEGAIEILPEFEQGLLDIEGFSHLFIIWVFHHSEGFELRGAPPGDMSPH